MKSLFYSALLLIMMNMLSSCTPKQDTIPTVGKVDIERFMGDWYVIANIPTLVEKGAHNAIESYQLRKNGDIAATFTFNADSFEGKRKQYNPVARIQDSDTNATWDMQFIWPFKAEYKIVYLDVDYQHTIIGRSKRDYLWIMSRQSQLSDPAYQKLLSVIETLGYDIDKIQKVPQRWPKQTTLSTYQEDKP